MTLLLVKHKWAPLLEADNGARDSLHSFAVTHNGFVEAMRLISNLRSTVAWQIVLGVVAVWPLCRRLPPLAVFVVITWVGSSWLNNVVKIAVNRLRPVLTDHVANATGPSIRSGHAQAAIFGYSVLLLVFLPAVHGAWRKAAWTLAIQMVVAIGFCRVARGVHSVSDVVGGFILGAAWVAALAAAFNAMRVDRGHRKVDVKAGLEPEQAQRLAGNLADGEEADRSE